MMMTLPVTSLPCRYNNTTCQHALDAGKFWSCLFLEDCAANREDKTQHGDEQLADYST